MSSSPVQMAPQAVMLMKGLHQVLVWIRSMAQRPIRNGEKTIAVLAHLTHNWPDWIAGNDFWRAEMFVSEIRETASRTDVDNDFWRQTISPFLVDLAQRIEDAGRAH